MWILEIANDPGISSYLESRRSNTVGFASIEYITVIITRIPKINDPRQRNGENIRGG